MMQSHLWLLIVTVAVYATVIYADTKMPLADDPLFNKILATTEENTGSRAHKIPMADDPRFNKMLPKRHFDLLEKEDTPKNSKVDKIVDINHNSINNSSKTDDDDYYDEENYDDNYDELTKVTPKKASSTTEAPAKVITNTIQAAPSDNSNPKDSSKLRLINDVDEDLDSDDEDDDSDDEDDDDDDDNSDLADNEPIVCPRDCVCNRNINGFMVATCSRLDAGVQKFSSGITDLEVVNVSQQYPIVLGAGFFEKIGLKDVSTIKIANSFIENVHPKAFEGLNDLYSVNLTNSGITVLHPDTFAENKKLRILTLDANDLSQMQQESSPFNNYMLKVPSVEELSLSRCNLKKLLPTAFTRLENIVFINLSYNDLKTLPINIFDKAPTIEELDLSSNNITNLPRNIFNRTALAILNLKYNKIESKLDFATPDIQKLDLSFNNITNIGSTMFNKMTGLTSLILKGNGIKKIHLTAFFSLKNLRQIDLSFNELEQVSASLFLGNRELDIIRLNDNYRLKSLPLEGFACESGKFNVYLFDLQNCDISELGDDTFKNMPRMTTLNLAWNNIESLSPEFFGNMTKLIELNLSNNVITELGNLTFLNNRNLKKLNLAGNPLIKISPRMFLPLKDLTELDISNCDLAEIWSEPMSSDLALSTVLKNLKLLNVSNNNIVHARHSHFSTMEKLEVLDLSNNHLHCDDGFKALIDWLKQHKIKAGSIHAGFNAKLTDSDTAQDTAASYSLGWDSFDNRTCSEHQAAVADKAVSKAEEYIDENSSNDDEDDSEGDEDDDDDDDIDDRKQALDNVDGDDSDSDDDDDEYDEEGEIEINSGNELRDGKNIIAEEIDSLSNRINDLESEVVGSHEAKLFAYNSIPILFILLTIVLILALVARVISMLVHRRGERYRQALLASKNSIIYQKLSEEINAPQTPKFHRYAPINQV